MAGPGPNGLDDALARLADIHAQVARGAHFQGYRARPVAAMGGIAVLAAALEPFLPVAPAEGACRQHALYWVGVAVFCAAIAAFDLVRRYGLLPRRTTALALGQLAPAALVGFVLLIALWRHAELLPGAWTMVFGLGILASAPYLPRAVAGVALYYIAAGAAMALAAEPGVVPSPWLMGVTFGMGQLASAAALQHGAAEEEGTSR